MLKPSYYNYFIKIDESIYYGYNFLHRSILKIPGKAFPLIQTTFESAAQGEARLEYDISKHLPEQWLSMFKEAYFLLDDDFDELSLIKMRYYRSLFANDSLSLIILPTLWCNLNCPYCFEIKRKGFMPPQVQDNLISWINNNFSQKRYINVSWFGGEPLLGQKIITNLSEGIQRICAENMAQYSASVTTNGYYLDSKFQAKIQALGIKSIQITLDGDKEHHDKSRTQLNGKGSFNKIYENIISFSKNIEDCSLIIRINCSDDNYHRIEKLLERFPESVRKKTIIFFRWIWANEATGYREFSQKARGEEEFYGLSYLYECARNLGWKTVNPHNKVADGYCEVDFFDHYCIDPEGDIYCCTHTFNKSESIGSVNQKKGGINEASLSYYSKWYAANPFEDSKCVSCILLPVCSGGCRKSRLEGKRNCIEERKSLDLYVKSILSDIMEV